MKLLNFAAGSRRSVGALVPAGVLDLGARLGVGSITELLRAGLVAPARSLAGMAAEAATTDYTADAVRWLNPAGRDSRIFCIGVNYPERNEEYRDGSERPKHPSIFTRTYASFADPGAPLRRPAESTQLDYEGEVAVMIGRAGRRIAEAEVPAHVFGYACANDGTLRDWVRHGKFNVTPGKNFDASGSLGPALVTADEVGTEPLRVRTRVNGELRQDDSTERMLFPIPRLLSYLSTFCALEPGDVVLTGTPSGAGARLEPPRWLAPGDVVEVEVSRVGLLRNGVADDAG